MAYRYEWSWQWRAERISLTDIPASELTKEIETQIRAQLTKQKQVTAIESIRHENVEHWTQMVGYLPHRMYSGTTKTVFLSTSASSSPIAPAVAAIVGWVIAAVIVLIVAFAIYTVASTVNELAEKAPAALYMGGGIIILGLLLLMGVRAPRRKE